MYSVIDFCGQQFKVAAGDKISVFSIEGEVEKEINLTKVLLFSDGDETTVGKPYLADASVTARVLSHSRDDKVLVFKKRRRKDYKKKTGHRQDLTELLITQVSMGGKKDFFTPRERPAKKEPVAEAAVESTKAVAPKKG
jgi:large subunit ribosomal protein L21